MSNGIERAEPEMDAAVAEMIAEIVAKIRISANRVSERRVDQAFERLLESLRVDVKSVPTADGAATVHELLVAARNAVLAHLKAHDEEAAIEAFVSKLTSAISAKRAGQ